MDCKLELVVIPVSDVDLAKRFYVEQLGFAADVDARVDEHVRFVQLTPPGSDCSIAIGEGIVWGEPGSVTGLQVVVPDVVQARQELLDSGVGVSDIEDYDWGSFVYFADPDGNRWSVQQMPPRAAAKLAA